MQQTVSQNPDLIILPASQWTGMIFMGFLRNLIYNKLKKGVLFKEPPVLNHQAGSPKTTSIKSICQVDPLHSNNAVNPPKHIHAGNHLPQKAGERGTCVLFERL